MPTSSTNDAYSASRSRFEQVCSVMGGETASSPLTENSRRS